MGVIYSFREDNQSSTDSETIERSDEEAERALFCKFCSNRITVAASAIEVNDSHNHTFFNPAGIIYEIRCFSSADGCIQYGPFSSEFSWFSGYSWRICLCSSCSEHMGWYFSSGELGFYGLISKNLSS